MRLFPLILIAVGLVTLLTNLGVLPVEWGRQWWPVLLIAIGVAALFRPPSMRRGRRCEDEATPDGEKGGSQK